MLDAEPEEPREYRVEMEEEGLRPESEGVELRTEGELRYTVPRELEPAEERPVVIVRVEVLGREEVVGRDTEGREEVVGREMEGREEVEGRETEGRDEVDGRETEGREVEGREEEPRLEPRPRWAETSPTTNRARARPVRRAANRFLRHFMRAPEE